MASDDLMHCSKCGYDGHPDYHDPFRCQVLKQLVDTAERAELTNMHLETISVALGHILGFLRENRVARLHPKEFH